MVQESIVTLLQINVKNPKHAMGNNADMTKIQKETKTNKNKLYYILFKSINDLLTELKHLT